MQNIPGTYYDTTSYPVKSDSKRRVGYTIGGGLLGMAAYHLPLSHDAFVSNAFLETKKVTEAHIEQLKKASYEISRNNLKDESKIFLNNLGVVENDTAVKSKIKSLYESITLEDQVKQLKDDLSSNYNTFKARGNAHSMDNIAVKTFQNVKWENFKWGVGICAALGLAYGLIKSRD